MCLRRPEWCRQDPREPGSLPQGRLGLCWGPVRLVTSLDYGAALGEGGPENTLPSTRAYGGGRVGKPGVEVAGKRVQS